MKPKIKMACIFVLSLGIIALATAAISTNSEVRSIGEVVGLGASIAGSVLLVLLVWWPGMQRSS